MKRWLSRAFVKILKFLDRFGLLHRWRIRVNSERLIRKLSSECLCERQGDILSVAGVRFKLPATMGLYEVFARQDYAFGGLSGCVFIDVGANIGDSALFCAGRKNIAHVYAYEPFPQTYRQMSENIQLNPELAAKITLSSDAWSDRSQMETVPEMDSVLVSAVNSTEPFFHETLMQRHDGHSVTLRLRAAHEHLAEILERHPAQPIVLKMDIEGAEYACFEDLHKHELLRKVDVLFVEWHFKGYQRLAEILEANGFVWFNEQFDSHAGFLRAHRMKNDH